MPREIDPNNALAPIIANTRAEVEARKQALPLHELEAMVAQEEPPRNFFRAVTRRRLGVGTSVIAEIKRKSPSSRGAGGWIRPEYADGVQGGGFDPAAFARMYHEGGAAAISCLTDRRFFGGDIAFVARVKEACPLPVLRKDFIVDPWQLWESRAFGADAVLLIAECLTEGELVDMLILAQQLQLTTLVEVHSVDNLLRVLPHIGFPHPAYGLLGINNRDLTTMRVDLSHTLRLAEMVEDRSVLVSESGIATPADLKRLRSVGVQMVLVGEHLMRQANPGHALAALLDDEGDAPTEVEPKDD